jgi:type IV fimbrial biogenesis protein FimT
MVRAAYGFTLIELMIGITILAIVITAGLPSYRQWIQNTQIRNASESILNGMQRARAEAVSRNTNVAFTLGGGSLWTVTQVSNGDPVDSKPNAEVPADVVVTPTPNDATTITFGNLGGRVNNADGTPPITRIDIDSSTLAAEDSRDLRITIDAGGGVRMCDPTVVSEADPRLCP